MPVYLLIVFLTVDAVRHSKAPIIYLRCSEKISFWTEANRFTDGKNEVRFIQFIVTIFKQSVKILQAGIHHKRRDLPYILGRFHQQLIRVQKGVIKKSVEVSLRLLKFVA